MMRVIVAILALLWMTAASRPAEPVLYVEDPGLLAQMEKMGFAFADIFSQAGDGNLETLHANAPAYRALTDTITADVEELRREIEAGGRPLREFTVAETGRLMDMRWLNTNVARFRLVAVVNRLDRRDFHNALGEAGCGEVRLVYRLAYAFRKDGRGKLLSSRMPFNFNAVFDVKPDADGGCVGVAGRWTPAIDENLDAGWLAGGPLDREALSFRQLELNAQVVRFPSGQEPEFGGQAVYLMRIFGIEGDAIIERTLENTPDSERIAGDAELKARLTAYVAEHSAAIDEGVYQVPSEFLARKVVSWSTFGNARAANHPFGAIFEPEDFAGLDLAGGNLVRSPKALIERLDNGTCQGCHQAGGTAGFHVIGLDDGYTSPLNRVQVGISPHLHAELPRRAAWVNAVREEREPNRFRQLSFAPPSEWRADGAMAYEAADAGGGCIAPQDEEAFGETWSCGEGTSCTPLASGDGERIALAQCLLPAESPEMFSGHPCLAGTVETATGMPFNDRFKLAQFTAFAQKASPSTYTCRPPRIGVPGGMAYRQCDGRDRAFASFKSGAPMPREICGLTGGKAFDRCVSTGNFDKCLSGAVQRGNRAACSADHFCRDDYICQAFPDDTPNIGKAKGVGFCSPTYFVFQMRIDNHATPWSKGPGRSGEGRAGGEEATYRSIEVDGDPDDLW
ncbi:MAG: hypothetical protein KF810_20595 [Rhizobiaceae bacterium]|nr:hypothetical protein [Rhizobiaceae bacterium]